MHTGTYGIFSCDECSRGHVFGAQGNSEMTDVRPLRYKSLLTESAARDNAYQ